MHRLTSSETDSSNTVWMTVLKCIAPEPPSAYSFMVFAEVAARFETCYDRDRWQVLGFITWPHVGWRSIAINVSVCLCVCPSVRSQISKTQVQILLNFPHALPVAVARSYSDGSVLPVSWMTSCFQIMVHVPWLGASSRRRATRHPLPGRHRLVCV